tara:strand:+ start:2680 stop:3027 length:348 start_codon:yes stop_codon:yes gene_type:complete
MATATSWTDAYAIFKAYPNVVRVNQDEGCFDASDNKIDVDQDNVDAARVELDKDKYRIQRTGELDPAFTGIATTDTIYASVQEQLDMQYWDAVNGTTTWKDHISAVKVKYPKPSS